jgi:hypothetical protein
LTTSSVATVWMWLMMILMVRTWNWHRKSRILTLTQNSI